MKVFVIDSLLLKLSKIWNNALCFGLFTMVSKQFLDFTILYASTKPYLNLVFTCDRTGNTSVHINTHS